MFQIKGFQKKLIMPYQIILDLVVIIVVFYLKEYKLDYTEIQSIISYKFQNQELLKTALQHASVNVSLYNYERLEFLGDSILNAIVSEWLYNNSPNQKKIQIFVSLLELCWLRLYTICLDVLLFLDIF